MSQGKIEIPDVNDGEQFLETDVSRYESPPSVFRMRTACKASLFLSHVYVSNACFSVFVVVV